MDRGYHVGIQTGRIDYGDGRRQTIIDGRRFGEGKVSIRSGTCSGVPSVRSTCAWGRIIIGWRFISAAVTIVAATALGLVAALGDRREEAVPSTVAVFLWIAAAGAGGDFLAAPAPATDRKSVV